MKTSKKILILIGSILGIALISATIAWCLYAMFELHFWGTFIFAAFLQIISPELLDRYTYSKNIRESIQEYAAKPFRKYEIPLTCQYCGHGETVDVDLNNTVYTCSVCERKNAVYVSFMTAVIQNNE